MKTTRKVSYRIPNAADKKTARLLLKPDNNSKIGKVILRLLSGRWLTSWQAIEFYGYTRLADGIYKLRDRFAMLRIGIIVTDEQHGVDRYDNPSQWGRYRWMVRNVAKNARKKRTVAR